MNQIDYSVRRPTQLRNSRNGALTIEMAFVVPVVLLFFFGLWEWSRVEMIKHVSQNACFEGARLGTLPGYSESDTESKVLQVLNGYLIKGATADASFEPGTGTSAVSVSIPIDANFTLGRAFFKGKTITAGMTLVQ